MGFGNYDAWKLMSPDEDWEWRTGQSLDDLEREAEEWEVMQWLEAHARPPEEDDFDEEPTPIAAPAPPERRS